ncbi:MAG: hypothetical protein ACREN5_08200, partial [Gemmatimonadales bacterium]
DVGAGARVGAPHGTPASAHGGHGLRVVPQLLAVPKDAGFEAARGGARSAGASAGHGGRGGGRRYLGVAREV